MEGSTEKTGGMAFDVILKPASSDATPPHVGEPSKERPLSQSDIDRKLKEAEERRHSMEASKLQPVTKDKERMHEANVKAHELSESFSKETERKLSEKMEVSQEKKNAQMLAKQERLKEHDRHVEEVRKKKLSQSEDANAAGETAE